MEVVKNIAAVLGLISTLFAVVSLLSKSVRNVLKKIFSTYGNDNDMVELKQAVEDLSNEFKDFKSYVEGVNDITLEFTKQQCRNIIVAMFYKYYDNKILPTYEYKTLLYVKKIYIERLHGNSYASKLIEEMEQWPIDYKAVSGEEE